jgi:hypothetical protein
MKVGLDAELAGQLNIQARKRGNSATNPARISPQTVRAVVGS